MKDDERRAMAILADDLRKENLAYRQKIEVYERQIESLGTDYTKAERDWPKPWENGKTQRPRRYRTRAKEPKVFWTYPRA